MSGRALLFVGRLPMDIRERDLEKVFEKYGRLIRCDVKCGTGRAYAFLEYDDRRDAEDAIKYENGREIRGQSIAVEWSRGPRSRQEYYGRSSSRQSREECFRCRRTGHWARNCPEQERDRYYPRSSRRSPRSRSRSRSYRRRRSVSRSRSKSRDRGRRSSSDHRPKSRSVSPERKRKARSPSRSVSPSKSPSRSRSRSPDKNNKKDKSKKSKVRTPSKTPSRSPSLNKSRSRSRSPSYSRKASLSPVKKNDTADKQDNGSRSVSRSPSKENNRGDDSGSDHSVSRSKSR